MGKCTALPVFCPKPTAWGVRRRAIGGGGRAKKRRRRVIAESESDSDDEELGLGLGVGAGASVRAVLTAGRLAASGGALRATGATRAG